MNIAWYHYRARFWAAMRSRQMIGWLALWFWFAGTHAFFPVEYAHAPMATSDKLFLALMWLVSGLLVPAIRGEGGKRVGHGARPLPTLPMKASTRSWVELLVGLTWVVIPFGVLVTGLYVFGAALSYSMLITYLLGVIPPMVLAFETADSKHLYASLGLLALVIVMQAALYHFVLQWDHVTGALIWAVASSLLAVALRPMWALIAGRTGSQRAQAWSEPLCITWFEPKRGLHRMWRRYARGNLVKGALLGAILGVASILWRVFADDALLVFLSPALWLAWLSVVVACSVFFAALLAPLNPTIRGVRSNGHVSNHGFIDAYQSLPVRRDTVYWRLISRVVLQDCVALLLCVALLGAAFALQGWSLPSTVYAILIIMPIRFAALVGWALSKVWVGGVLLACLISTPGLGLALGVALSQAGVASIGNTVIVSMVVALLATWGVSLLLARPAKKRRALAA